MPVDCEAGGRRLEGGRCTGEQRPDIPQRKRPVDVCVLDCPSVRGDLFRSVPGPGVDVERTELIVAGDRRCAYRVIEQR